MFYFITIAALMQFWRTSEPQTLSYQNLVNQKILVIGGGGRMGLAVARLAISLSAEAIISSRSAVIDVDSGERLGNWSGNH